MAAITPLQLKLARTALGLGVRELAQAAGVSPTTVSRFEAGKSTMLVATLDRLQSVLEQGGVMFIAPDATCGIGIRLKL